MGMKYFPYWLLAALLIAIGSNDILGSIEGIFWALIFSFILIVATKSNEQINLLSPYLLFFTISFTSFIGLTKTLTGSHSTSSISMLYGLSFYTASIAYLHKKKLLKSRDVWKVSNPMLLFTGPIALFIKDIRYRSTRNRLNFYLPFFTIGLFYFKIIGAPLVSFMFLINETDIISSILFATIFEIFVYANFCGLSLMIYGISGIIGYKVPLNFKQPFSANNIIDFWRGWHISLSVVLKELFYNPLRKKIGILGTLVVVYLASAMWHGIAFNFILWGILHALLFYITILINRYQIIWKNFFSTSIMFIAIIFGRFLFAESNFNRLIQKLHFNFVDYSIFEIFYSVPKISIIALFFGIVFIAIEFIFKKNYYVNKRTYKHLRLPISQFIMMLIFLLLAMNFGGEYAIYGQR
jgi:alginate O-acetyltransferase complex protein AlgI